MLSYNWTINCLIIVVAMCCIICTNGAAVSVARAADLSYTEITPVTNETRYTTLHPDVLLTPFKKSKHVKGNIVFTAGLRITGDRLILKHNDDTTFTKAADIEVLLKYPAEGTDGLTISCIEIYVDLSADDANAYFTQGGIEKTFAEILLTCDQTRTFVYETFFYGY